MAIFTDPRYYCIEWVSKWRRRRWRLLPNTYANAIYILRLFFRLFDKKRKNQNKSILHQWFSAKIFCSFQFRLVWFVLFKFNCNLILCKFFVSIFNRISPTTAYLALYSTKFHAPSFTSTLSRFSCKLLFFFRYLLHLSHLPSYNYIPIFVINSASATDSLCVCVLSLSLGYSICDVYYSTGSRNSGHKQ